MGLNETVSADRAHIGFFGVRNAGKSSVVNAVTGQALSIVSDVAGTTTDPVRKAMELLPAGPVVIVDTPGIDDEGSLGEQRVQSARRALRSVDVAVLVVDALSGISSDDLGLVRLFEERGVPYVVALNKVDASGTRKAAELSDALAAEVPNCRCVAVSALSGEGIEELKQEIGLLAAGGQVEKRIVSDIVGKGELAVLVVPIDKAAPKGRLILPQQQTIRDLLDGGAAALVVREVELEGVLAALRDPPRMVICDSQVFDVVADIVPNSVPLTSFSILFARYKADLSELVSGAQRLATLKDGDKVLIAEGCTHRRQCGDIGTEKIPRWIEGYCKAEPAFEFCSGRDFPDDLSPYSLVVHCGGCMLTGREMQWRVGHAKSQGVPIVNYGVAIAKMKDILERALSPYLFPLPDKSPKMTRISKN